MLRVSVRRLSAVLALSLLVAGLLASPCRAQWTVVLNDNATFTLSYDGSPVVTSGWNGWGPNWKYTPPALSPAGVEGDLHRFSGVISGERGNMPGDIDMQVDVRAQGAGRFVYTITATPKAPLKGAIGFCLAFNPDRTGQVLHYKPSLTYQLEGGKSITLASADESAALVLKQEDAEANKLARTGFDWHLPGGQAIKARFDKPARASYEFRQHSLRMWFAMGDVPAEPQILTITFTFPKGTRAVESEADRYGPSDLDNWHKDALAWNTSPVDLSFLNEKPAGKRGFVKAKDGDFVFEDGTPVRFWGGNLAASALFSDDKDAVAAQAKRIAAMGFNLMRIHHHDSMTWVTPTVIDKSKPHSQELDKGGMAALDWLLHCLKQEGVYIYLDLHVGRAFKEGDNIPGWDQDMAKDDRGRGVEGKGFCYYNDRIEQLMKEFNERYLNHVNPHTGLAYKDEPAIMGMLITNENDLTMRGNKMLGDKGHPFHNKIFLARVKAFCQETGLPEAQTGRTWEYGPSKRYLCHEQAAWATRMMDHVRNIGGRVPIAANQFWARMGMWDLPGLAVQDMMDVHSYGGRALPLSTNPRHSSNFVIRITTAQLDNMPLVITEWHTPLPARWRATSPMYMAAIGSLQGWDAPMLYNYSQARFGGQPGRTHRWTSYADPGIMSMMPAAALAFRRGDFAPGRKTVLIRLDEAQTYNQGLSDTNMTALRTLAELHRFSIAPAGTEPAGQADEVLTDVQKNFLPVPQVDVTSDTGEIYRNWEAGVQMFNTPRTQGAQGFIGIEPAAGDIGLDTVSMDIQTPFASVVCSSLDGKPLSESTRILITAIGRAVTRGNRFPYYTEPIVGTVRIENSNPGMKLTALGPDGAPLAELPMQKAGAAYEVKLTAGDKTHWYLLAE